MRIKPHMREYIFQLPLFEDDYAYVFGDPARYVRAAVAALEYCERQERLGQEDAAV